MEYNSDDEREEQLKRIGEHQRTPIDDVIAEEKLIAIINGESREIVLQVGRPVLGSDGVGTCPVAAWGLDERYSDAMGEGTLQALNLACALLRMRLIDTISDGHARLYYPGELDQELTASSIKTIFGITHRRKRPVKTSS